MAFHVGDRVTWASQAGGNTKAKVGTVIAVIDGGRCSGERASKEISSRVRNGTHRSAYGGGWDRADASYVVEVIAGPRAKPVLYWPVASRLKPA